MPFLRVTRDRRGFEHVAILHQDVRRGRSRPTLVYFSRMPPSLRVGRMPLDADTRRAIEHAHPDLIFDWARLQYAPGRARGEASPA